MNVDVTRTWVVEIEETGEVTPVLGWVLVFDRDTDDGLGTGVQPVVIGSGRQPATASAVAGQDDRLDSDGWSLKLVTPEEWLAAYESWPNGNYDKGVKGE